MTPQIKICGLTVPEEARACAEAGADAIGLVFFPESPRFLDLARAKEIRAALPPQTIAVGVFVDAPLETMIVAAQSVGFQTLQLHGEESPLVIQALVNVGFRVIKALKTQGQELLEEALIYQQAHGFIVEGSKGSLPGGNGLTWDWSGAMPLAEKRPFILAGGLNADNIALALQQSGASAIDLSSGAESSPGRKDIEKVRAIIAAARSIEVADPFTGAIFQ